MVTDSATVTMVRLQKTNIALSNGVIAVPYDRLFPQNGGSICPLDTRKIPYPYLSISPQRVIRYTSCLVLG